MPDLDVDRYWQTMKALANSVTDVNPASAGRRMQRTASTAMVDVRVVSGNNSVVLLLQESGLYIKGFRNGAGTFLFKTDPPGVGGTPLSFSCSYIGTRSIGIYEDEAVAAEKRTKLSIDQAIRVLSAYTAGETDNKLKVPLALLVMLVSESIRFTVVYDRMVEVCKGEGASFTFKEVQKWVQAWADISSGVLPAGTNRQHVYTHHSLPTA